MPIVRDFLDTYRKRPTAKETIAVDFRDRIPNGQTPVSHEVKVYDSTGSEVTGSLIQTSGLYKTRVSALLYAGTDLQDYYVVFAAICDTERPEATIKLEVRS